MGRLVVGVALVVTGCGLLIASPTVATSGPAAVLIGWSEQRHRRVRAEQDGAVAALVLAVDQLIQRLRSGASLASACRVVLVEQSAVPGLGPVARALAHGRPLAAAVTSARTADAPSVRLLGVTLAVLAANGGPAVPALQRLSMTLTGSVHGRRQARAQGGQAVASAAMMACTPLVFAVVVGVLSPAAARFYLYDSWGAFCVGGAVLLSYAGWRWMQHHVALLERRVA